MIFRKILPRSLAAGRRWRWLIACVSLASATALASDAGQRLAQAVYDRPAGDDVTVRAIMTLTEKGHSPRVREMFTFAKELGGGERWTFARFTKPADIAGVGLLTKDHTGDDSEQWLYLPALDRVRRISSSRKGGRFVGSDLFFEDLRDREPDMDTHTLQGKSKLGKLECDVLVSVPVKASNSVYSKRVSWVHPATLVPLRVDLYQKGSDKPSKRMDVKRLKRLQGYWTVLDSVAIDLQTGHQTRITAKAVKYDQGLPRELFSTKALSDDSVDRRYRP